MQNIVQVFKPWLDAHPEVSIRHTQDSGWVCVSNLGEDPITRTHMDQQQFLTLLAAWFFDETEDMTWAGAAEQAIKDMAPYLVQLTPEQVQRVDQALELYAKLDDL